MQVKVLPKICFTFAMDTSAPVAAAADDDEDSDFLSRILGIFLGDSDAAAGAEPVDIAGSGAGGPLWDWSGSIFWRFKGETAKLNFVQYWKGAMANYPNKGCIALMITDTNDTYEGPETYLMARIFCRSLYGMWISTWSKLFTHFRWVIICLKLCVGSCNANHYSMETNGLTKIDFDLIFQQPL